MLIQVFFTSFRLNTRQQYIVCLYILYLTISTYFFNVFYLCDLLLLFFFFVILLFNLIFRITSIKRSQISKRKLNYLYYSKKRFRFYMFNKYFITIKCILYSRSFCVKFSNLDQGNAMEKKFYFCRFQILGHFTLPKFSKFHRAVDKILKLKGHFSAFSCY